MNTSPPRVYADFNGFYRGDSYDWVELDVFGTLADLHFQKIALAEGLELMAWDHSDDDEDIEAVGTCHFHPSGRGHWCLHFPCGSLSYVPRRHQITGPMLCFRCRHQVTGSLRQPEVETCPSCGLSIHFPWLPPATQA